MAAHVAHTFAEGYRALCQLVLAYAGVRPTFAGARGGVGQPVPAPARPLQPLVDAFIMRRLATLEGEEALLCLLYDGDGSYKGMCEFIGDGAFVDCDHVPLLRAAVALDARFAVMAHNHPSGVAQPSRADIQATRQIYRMLRNLGVTLVDHAIVARGGEVFSFRQAGLM